MSLVGSLEDLGLGDILQIITLSRKSGALLLRSDDGEGRVIFRDGLVCGARVKNQTPDLRQLLVDGGDLSETEFEAVRTEASESGTELAAALRDRLTPERFEVRRRECVERAVLTMFAWEAGEFSFEVGEDEPADDFEVMLEAGINAQYLAMEGTRRTDEDGREPEVDADDPASFADVAEEIDNDDTVRFDGVEAVALTTAERVDQAEGFETTEAEVEEALEAAIAGELETTPAEAGEPASAEGGEPEPAVVDVEPAAVEAKPAAVEAKPAAVEAKPAVAPPAPGKRPPVVVVAPDLPMLEWVKRALEGAFRRVHIFQKAELAVQRLRQYMARGDSPLVLVAPGLAAGSEPGFRDVDDLVARMKKQSPRSSVLWLGERADPGSADGAVFCASAADVASPMGPDPGDDESLRNGVLQALAGAPSAASGAGGEAVRDPRLEAVVARMEDPKTRGEVLNVVLDFGAEHFERVALLAVREGQAMGVAGLGLERADGPDDEDLRDLSAAVPDSSWLRAVVEERRTVRAAPEGEGDRELARALGADVPAEAWLSPVISGGQVVAILYGDNLPGGAPLGASEALEAALAKAGEVLEQAMEERARGIA
jgi:hypothetical protein